MVSICWLDSLEVILIVCLDGCLKSETRKSKVPALKRKKMVEMSENSGYDTWRKPQRLWG
jgi:hypothetical protein